MRKRKYDAWGVKTIQGNIILGSIHLYRTTVVDWWNKDARDKKYVWRNMSRRLGLKIIKIKFLEEK